MRRSPAAACLHAPPLVLLLMLTLGRAASGDKIAAGVFLAQTCSRYKSIFDPLIRSQLDAIRDPISLHHLLQPFPQGMEEGNRINHDLKGGWPVMYIVDGELMQNKSMPRPGEAPLFGYETYGLHVMAALSRKVYLPNLAMLYTPYDNHMFSRTADEPGPWFAYCGQPDRNNLLLPHTLEPSKVKCKEGSVCKSGPGDTREGKAAFFGGATGWSKGRRRAVFVESRKSPHRIHAVLTAADPGALYPDDLAHNLSVSAEGMDLDDQVTRFKYLIHADGHCAALRLKDQLSSPSALFKVTSLEEEWFTKLLKPYVHFIPVSFDVHGDGSGYSLDLAQKVEWAEQHPDAVARIVVEANKFANTVLSPEGAACYTVGMLKEYAQLQTDPWLIQEHLDELQTPWP